MPKTETHGKKAGVTEALEQLDSYFDQAEEKKFDDVPKGAYQVKIDSATINNSKSSGRLQCSWAATIVSPKEWKGRKLFWHDGMDNEDSLGWLRGALARIGIEWPKTAKGLPAALEEAVGTYAEVKCRPSKDSDIMNTRFVKALDSKQLDIEADDAPEAKVAGDDDDEKPAKAKKPVAKDDDDDEKPAPKKGKPAADDDDDEKPAAKPSPKAKDDDDDEPEKKADPEVTVTFKTTDEEMGKEKRVRIKKAAVSNEFDPVDYATKVDLLTDVAEHLGITGEFDDLDVLLTKVEKRTAKALAAKAAPAADDDD